VVAAAEVVAVGQENQFENALVRIARLAPTASREDRPSCRHHLLPRVGDADSRSGFHVDCTETGPRRRIQ
jgi:hypothetical protein